MADAHEPAVGDERRIADLAVGMTATSSRTLTDADVARFAELTGDTNPVHLDQAYAEATPFRGRIVHGMLSASLISAVLGTKLPGPGAIYLSQTLRFTAPVRVGDTVAARVTVTALDPATRRATMDTVCTVAGRVVVEGEACVLMPSRG